MATVNEKMTAIADNIREKTGGAEALTLEQMASGVNEVYEAGKQKEWSDFWDIFQQNGKRTGYERAFYSNSSPESERYKSWTDENFKPKYSMYPTNLNRTFFYTGFTDFKNIFVKNGLVFDTSKCTDFNSAFAGSCVTQIGVLDLSNTTTISDCFAYCYNLKSVEKMILSEKATTYNSPFVACNALTEIRFDGVIQKSLSFSWSPLLTIASLKSIITHLKDYSGTTSEYTYTVTFKTSAFEALEAEGNTSPNGNTWTEYIDDLKWNLTLA